MSTQIISFQCILKNKAGDLISSTFNQNIKNIIEDNGTFLKGLMSGLQNLKTGEKRTISLTADEAYGSHDPKKIILFPIKKLARETSLKDGAAVKVVSKTGTSREYRVGRIHGDMVTLDGNHPLAGQDLIYEIEATEVQKA
jgi:FKBP-type peptidyl-prolyl cis-trans isomerase SlyD